MPEGLTVAHEDLPYEQRMDMSQFENEYAEQTSILEIPADHTCNVECDHRHADAHVDHPEDHETTPTDHHETEHEHEKHTHDHKCGHIGHEDAHTQVDRHITNKHSPHTRHGEEKAHLNADRKTHHHERTPAHKHHHGCGHEEYEHVARHIEKPHVHSKHCGHEHHSEVNKHIDHLTHTSSRETHAHMGAKHNHHPGCGHIEFEHAHKHVDDIERRHHEPVETVRSHSETTQLLNSRHEITAQIQATAEVEAIIRHKVGAEVHAPTSDTSDAPAAPVHEVASLAVTTNTETQDRDHIAALAHELSDSIVNTREEPSTAIVQEGSATEPFGMETASTTPVILEVSPSAAQVTETKLVLENEPSTVSEVSPAVELLQAAEPSQEFNVSSVELQVSNEMMPAAISEETPLLEVSSGVTIETVADTLLDGQNIDAVVLSAREQPATAEAPTIPLLVPAESSGVSQPEFTSDSTTTPELSLHETIETLINRDEGITERLTLAASEQSRTVHAVINNLSVDVRAAQESGILPSAIQSKIVELLHMLGFENPSQTLQSYIHQYGIRFLDELLTRFLEILNRCRSFERLHILQSQLTAPQQATGITHVIGTIALQLFKPGKLYSLAMQS
jgi:hypothetical protein